VAGLSAHGGPVLLGTVLACYGVPRTVLIPVGGILADKIGARTIMLAADAARCVLVTALVVLASQRLASLPLLAPVAALLGAGEGLFLPASFTIMPALLKPDQLAAGNALSSAMVQAGSLAGPVLGGLLVASAGSAPAFAVNAATFAVSAITLALLRPASLTTAAPAPAPADDAGAAGSAGGRACLAVPRPVVDILPALKGPGFRSAAHAALRVVPRPVREVRPWLVRVGLRLRLADHALGAELLQHDHVVSDDEPRADLLRPVLSPAVTSAAAPAMARRVRSRLRDFLCWRAIRCCRARYRAAWRSLMRGAR
jgi:MFS family permease